MFLTIVIIAVSILLFIIQSTRKPSALPPGLPRYQLEQIYFTTAHLFKTVFNLFQLQCNTYFRYPLVGSGHHLAPNLHVVFKRAIKVYGKVFSLYLGNVPCVVVAEFDTFKELMSCDELLDRPLLGATDDFFFPDENGKSFSKILVNEIRGIIT